MKELIEILGITPDSIGTIQPNIPCLRLPAELLKSAVTILMNEDQDLYLSAIIGQEWNEKIDIMYFFIGDQEIVLRFDLPLENPVIASISDLLIGAAFYERECHEMIGVHFEGLQNSNNLLLPADNHTFPLRKDSSGGRS